MFLQTDIPKVDFADEVLLSFICIFLERVILYYMIKKAGTPRKWRKVW